MGGLQAGRFPGWRLAVTGLAGGTRGCCSRFRLDCLALDSGACSRVAGCYLVLVGCFLRGAVSLVDGWHSPARFRCGVVGLQGRVCSCFPVGVVGGWQLLPARGSMFPRGLAVPTVGDSCAGVIFSADGWLLVASSMVGGHSHSGG